MAIPMLKIKWSRDRLILNMGISIPGKDCLYIETGPRFFEWKCSEMHTFPGIGDSYIRRCIVYGDTSGSPHKNVTWNYLELIFVLPILRPVCLDLVVWGALDLRTTAVQIRGLQNTNIKSILTNTHTHTYIYIYIYEFEQSEVERYGPHT